MYYGVYGKIFGIALRLARCVFYLGPKSGYELYIQYETIKSC